MCRGFAPSSRTLRRSLPAGLPRLSASPARYFAARTYKCRLRGSPPAEFARQPASPTRETHESRTRLEANSERAPTSLEVRLRLTFDQAQGEKSFLQLFNGTPRKDGRVLSLVRRVRRKLVGPTTAAHQGQ